MKAQEAIIVVFATRLAVAALLGIAIGFERQWRQRSAGLHTSSLVAIGAALFALLDTVLGKADTTRIVAGVVTGVGFIAGGVILKSGPNITGLNTAATIWATAAVGALAGFGLWREAGTAAATVIVLNLVLQPVADAIDARAKRTQEVETRYQLSVVCDRQSQPAASTAVVAAVSASPLVLRSLAKGRAEGDSVELVADILSPKSDDATVEALSTSLMTISGVRRSDWESTS